MKWESAIVRIDLFTPPRVHPLHPFVISIFRCRARDAFTTETILPKGNVDIAFNLGPVQRVTTMRGTFDWTGALVCGLHTRPAVSNPDRAVHIFGVSLRPDTSSALLGASLDDLTDRPVDGSLVFRDADALLNRLGEAASFAMQCDILLSWLAARLLVTTDTMLVARACGMLRREVGPAGVRLAAQMAGLSPRHLQRLFVRHVGLTPCRYMRLMRFVEALPLIPRKRTLADVAAHARYFDQPHFAREFRAFAGMTPAEYRQAGPVVAGHLFR